MEMRFNVNDVLPFLSACASLVSQKNTIPVLSSVLVEANTDQTGVPHVFFTTSDGENFLNVQCDVHTCDDGLRFCVDANDFLRALRNLADSVLTVRVKNGTMTGLYYNGQFTLPCIDDTVFPPQIKVGDDGYREASTRASVLSYAIDKTSIAMGNDPIRPILSGLNFNFVGNTMTVVGTDAQRLVKVTVTNDVNNDIADGFTLPSKPTMVLRSLVRDGGMVYIKFDNRHVTFFDGVFHLTARLTDGNYPKYETIIPKNECVTATIEKQELISALRRTTPMGSNTSNLVALNFDENSVVVSAEDVDFMKSAKEKVSCSYKGMPFAIGFKGNMLMEMIGSMNKDNISMELRSPSMACIMRPCEDFPSTEYLSLIMPMMIE